MECCKFIIWNVQKKKEKPPTYRHQNSLLAWDEAGKYKPHYIITKEQLPSKVHLGLFIEGFALLPVTGIFFAV